MGLTDDVPLKYTVTIRGIYTTVEKGKVTLIDGHSPHPCTSCLSLLSMQTLFNVFRRLDKGGDIVLTNIWQRARNANRVFVCQCAHASLSSVVTNRCVTVHRKMPPRLHIKKKESQHTKYGSVLYFLTATTNVR